VLRHHVDHGPEGDSVGDRYVGHRPLYAKSGEVVGHEDWVFHVLHSMNDGETRIYGDWIMQFPAGEIFYKSAPTPALRPLSGTGPLTPSGVPRLIIGGTGVFTAHPEPSNMSAMRLDGGNTSSRYRAIKRRRGDTGYSSSRVAPWDQSSADSAMPSTAYGPFSLIEISGVLMMSSRATAGRTVAHPEFRALIPSSSVGGVRSAEPSLFAVGQIPCVSEPW